MQQTMQQTIHQQSHDLAVEALKGSPAVAGAVASTMTMNEWVIVGTAIYIVIQAMYLVRKWWREELDREYVLARRRVEDAREDDDWAQRHKPKEPT